MLWVWVMFSSLDLVRRNINRAVSDNMVGDTLVNDLGLHADWTSLMIWASIPSTAFTSVPNISL